MRETSCPSAVQVEPSDSGQGEWRVVLSTVEIIGAFLGQLVKFIARHNEFRP